MRTEIYNVVQGTSGRWSVEFVSYKGTPGSEYVCNRVTSAEVFETEDQAWAGANRAMDLLESTEQFPNLTEAF